MVFSHVNPDHYEAYTRRGGHVRRIAKRRFGPERSELGWEGHKSFPRPFILVYHYRYYRQPLCGRGESQPDTMRHTLHARRTHNSITHHGPIRTELGQFPAVFSRSFLGGAGDDAVEGSLTLRFVVGADTGAKQNPIRHLVLEMCGWVGDPTMAPSGQNWGSSRPFLSVLFWVRLVAML